MLDASPPSCIAAESAKGSIIERLIVALFRGEQPFLRFAPSVVDAQTFQQNRRQRDVSWNTALAPREVSRDLCKHFSLVGR